MFTGSFFEVPHGKSLSDTEITKAILASVILSISEKLNMALFPAIRNDAGTTSMDLFNGFDTIAQNEITANTISLAIGNLFAFTESITSNNAYDLLKAFYRNATDELQSIPTKMFLPKDIYNAYVDDYQQTVGAAPYNKEFKKTFLEGSNDLCELVALPSKRNSPFIQLTTKKNMLVGSGGGNDLEKLSVDRFSAFDITLSLAAVFGVQYESITPDTLMIGKLFTAPQP